MRATRCRIIPRRARRLNKISLHLTLLTICRRICRYRLQLHSMGHGRLVNSTNSLFFLYVTIILSARNKSGNFKVKWHGSRNLSSALTLYHRAGMLPFLKFFPPSLRSAFFPRALCNPYGQDSWSRADPLGGTHSHEFLSIQGVLFSFILDILEYEFCWKQVI